MTNDTNTKEPKEWKNEYIPVIYDGSGRSDDGRCVKPEDYDKYNAGEAVMVYGFIFGYGISSSGELATMKEVSEQQNKQQHSHFEGFI